MCTLAQSEIDSLSRLLDTQRDDSTKVSTYLQFFYTDLFYDDQAQVIAYTRQAMQLSKRIGYAIGEVEAATTLGYIYRIRSENDSAFLYFGKGLEKATELAYTKGQFDALTGLGNTNNQMGKWEDAVGYLQRVEQLGKDTNDSTMIASANNNMGNIFLSNGMLSQALQSYQLAADIGTPALKGTALINIGLVHMELNNSQKARSYLLEALGMSKKSKNQFDEAFIYEHLGSIHQRAGERSMALDYFEQATRLFKSINARYHASDVLTNIAEMHLEDDDYQQALETYNESLTIQKEIDHFVGQCNNYLGIGRTQLAQDKYDLARRSLETANKLADEHNLLTAKDNIVANLSKVYAATGDFQKALEYQILLGQLSDSILNQEKSRQLTELETMYATTQKEQEIELLSAENEIASLQLQKQQNLKNYLIATAVFLVIIIFVLYSRYQIKVKTNSKLQELDEIKSSFFTNISHEFRTPLTLILSPVQSLLSNKLSAESRQELEIVQRNANQLLELTNQLLDLSKLEAGNLTLQVSPKDFQIFLKRIIASFESLAEVKSIQFTHDLIDVTKEVWFDEDKLQKVFNNLLSNAFKFTPNGGDILLTAKIIDNNIQVSIKDSGPGIPKEDQTRIFRRFHQSRITSSSPGTGIGLTLTKELITLHHGQINVESDLGSGSTFTITFPKNKSAYATFEHFTDQEHLTPAVINQGQSADAESSEILETGKPVVLIVEDNEDLRLHMIQLLQEKFLVQEAANGKLGLEQASEILPDIIISDLMMPEMDGISLCNALKTNEKTNHIPIILLTAKADRDSKLEGLKYGADDYLTKPFDNEELQIRIENLIKQRAELRSKYSQILLLEPSQIEVKSPDEEFIRKALEVVEQHLADTNFSVEQFQMEMGMSRMQLHRKLKALTELSTSEFIRDLRLKRAADFITDQGMNIAEAAYSSGFNTISYFTKCFKEKYGETPSNFAKKVS